MQRDAHNSRRTDGAFVWALLFLLLLPSAGKAREPGDEPAIHVTATGTVASEPELVRLFLAVETPGKTAAEAVEANAARMARAIDRLKRMGLSDGQIQTSGFALTPRYDYERPRRPNPEPIGFVAQNTIQVTIDSVAHVGRAIDAAVGAGINQATGLRFELRNPEAAYLQALRAAMASARAQAETLAEAAGGLLGPPLRISTSFSGPAPKVAAVRAFEQAATTPIEGSAVETTATVTVIYRFDAR